jgi:shikimate O-hydroxycinnamoyltransferase
VATVVPRKVPLSLFDHASIEFGKRAFNHSKSYYDSCHNNNAQNLTLRFSADFISKLKALVPRGCTKFECLLAHVWKKVTVARGLKENDFTQIRVAVNCRGRVNPAVPLNFFGNMVLWAFPKLRVIDLVTSSYEHVINEIREAIALVNDAYIKSFIDFGAATTKNDEVLVASCPAPGAVLSPDLEVDSWLGFSIHDLDFGYGKPCAFFTPNIPIEGLTVLASSCMERGAVEVHLALSKEHIDVLKKICYSIY